MKERIPTCEKIKLSRTRKDYHEKSYSCWFKRDLRIVYLVKKIGKKVHTELLFSTDLQSSFPD